MSGWKSAPHEVLIEWSHGYLPMKIFFRCMSSRGLYDPYDVIGGDFWVKNIKYFIFILFLAPKKIFENLARAENFDPIFDPLLAAQHHFWEVDPIFQKCPRGNLGSVQSLKKIVCAVFLRIKMPRFWSVKIFKPLQDLIRAPVSRLAKTKFLSNHFFSLRSRKDWKANFSDTLGCHLKVDGWEICFPIFSWTKWKEFLVKILFCDFCVRGLVRVPFHAKSA